MAIGRRVLLAGVVVVAVVIAGIAVRSLWSGPVSGVQAGVCDDPDAQQEVDPPEAGPAPEVSLPDSAVQTIATDLCAPWDLDFLPDGTALVTERDTARILSVSPDGQRVTEVQHIAEARPRGADLHRHPRRRFPQWRPHRVRARWDAVRRHRGDL